MTTTSTAQWIGAGTLGACAYILVALAWRVGAGSAHARADRARAAYLAERATKQAAPTETPAPIDFPPIPEQPPASADDLQTLQLAEVRALRARHRKGQHAWN
ncbi:hypothetical protein [Streptomyces sp. NPDC002692]